jgi:acrylyl-CoA reductase (NADPH)
MRLYEQGVTPENGEVLVTGASGGVGSLAVAILAQAGYRVVAATGKEGAHRILTRLGAQEVITREQALDRSDKALLKGRWAGVVDTVGGGYLATALKSTHYGGVVTCCGNVASAELVTSVYPFILRGVRLVGIDIANCPLALRQELWQKLATAWRLPILDELVAECSLDQLEGAVQSMLHGQVTGRIVVNLGGV